MRLRKWVRGALVVTVALSSALASLPIPTHSWAAVKNTDSGVSATPESEVEYHPFSKEGLPLLKALPRSASKDDRRFFGALKQDETELISCRWNDQSLSEARATAERLSISDLLPGQHKDQLTNAVGNAIFNPISNMYYGKIDKHDLWISKYWGRGLYTSASKIYVEQRADLFYPHLVASSVEKEEIKSDFRNPKGVLIEYRSTPLGKRGLEGVIFGFNADFVKFKELYAASRHYCTNHERPNSLVVGWRRKCTEGAVDTKGQIETSETTDEKNTMMIVGFVCA